MEEKCLCESNEILIFSCAGSANVGQIANQAAIQLAQRGVGRYFCLAGIGGLNGVDDGGQRISEPPRFAGRANLAGSPAGVPTRIGQAEGRSRRIEPAVVQNGGAVK